MTVRTDRRGDVALVTLDRPEVHNCIDPPTAEALETAILDLSADPSVAVVVLSGAGGRAFSSGADLRTAEELFRVATESGRPPLRFSDLEAGKPTIAAVEGYCLAGGLELALWCDVRIAGAGSRFGVVNRRWGIPLVDGGTQRLPRVVGLGNALYLIETGALMGAERAREMGLVQEVVPEGGALERAVELAGLIAAYARPTLLADRASTLGAPGLGLRAGLDVELEEGLRAAEGMTDGLARWAEGDRPPPPVGG